MATFQDVELMTAKLAVAYPYFWRQLTADDIVEIQEAYTAILGDIPADVLFTAAAQVAASCKFFPSAAELREKAFAIQDSASPAGYLSPHEAWEEFRGGLGHSGPEMSQPYFEHEEVRRVAQMLGWRDFCLSDIDQLSSWRKQFIDAYSALVERKREEARLLPQTKQVIAKLRAEQAAKLLGDVTARLRVSKGGEDAA